MASVSLLQLIEKTSDWDKDERYMATNDLCNLLSKDVKIDEHIEQKMCAAILKQLDDPSNDVQSVAVKCLAVLVKKVHQNQIGEICKKLSDLVIAGQDALRDIYSIGLKTLILDVPESMGPLVVEKLATKVLNGIVNGSEEAKRECLENMGELLKRFGALMEASHSAIVTGLLDILKSPKPVLRKRATNALGALAVVSNDLLLNELMKSLLSRIRDAQPTSFEARTLIQTIGVISRNVGYRLGCYLPSIVPLFIQFCGDAEDEDSHTEACNDLREACLPGLESFVLRAPKEVSPFLEQILTVGLAFMRYDPNYSYCEDEDNEEGSEEEDYGDYGDEDDDGSWKVRKAAVRVVDAIITAHSTWEGLMSRVSDEVLGRFKEREENVKLDVIRAYTHLLEVHTRPTATAAVVASTDSVKERRLIRQHSLVNEVLSRVDHIVSTSCSQLQGKSVKAKVEVLTMLKALMMAGQGGLERHLSKLFAFAEKFLKDKNQALKLETLQFLRVAFQQHMSSAHALAASLPSLLPRVLAVAKEDWYKSIAESLRLLAVIIPVMRPLHRDEEGAMDVTDTADVFPYRNHLDELYAVISMRLHVLDMDLEIKEASIATMGTLVASMGDSLSAAQLEQVWAVFGKRLENETTRIATLKAVQAIATSPLHLNLTPAFLAPNTTQLAFFLRQHSRSLKLLTLTTLLCMLCGGSALGAQDVLVLVKEIVPLLTDTDLYLTHLGLQLLTKLFISSPTNEVVSLLHPKVVALARSASTQKPSLDSLIALVKELILKKQVSFEALLKELYKVDEVPSTLSSVGGPSPRAQAMVIAKVVAGICRVAAPAQVWSTVQGMLGDISNTSAAAAAGAVGAVGKVVLALLCVGEVGQTTDLSALPLSPLLLGCMESSSEEVMSAAAYALGHIAIGNMSTFLPVLLQALGSASGRRAYALLSALRENILLYAPYGVQVEEVLGNILTVLLSLVDGDESVRALLADCLGILLTLSSDKVLAVLEDLYATPAASPAASSKHCLVAHSLRAAFARPLTSAQVDQFTSILPTYLMLVKSEDLEIKRAGLQMVNTLLHHNPAVVSGYVSHVIHPVWLHTLTIKMERVVDLGPFKHRVDDNLPLRKLCLACLETLLTSLPERLDGPALLTMSPALLADDNDVKLLYLQMLPRVAEVAPHALLGSVEDMIPALEKILEKSASKESAEKENASKDKDLVKAVVRWVFRVDRMEPVRGMRRWTDFSNKVRRAESIAAVVKAVELESLEQQGGGH